MSWLDRLDDAERSAVGVARALLWIAVLGLAALVIAAIVTRKPGGNTQGEYFYFGAAVVLAFGWIIHQFARLRARVRRAERRRGAGDGRAGLASWSSRTSGAVPLEGGAGFAKSRVFRFGNAPPSDADAQFTVGRSFNVPLASLPADALPDDTTLDMITDALERGDRLEDACESVEPAYRHWGMMERRAYRLLVEAKLEQRRRAADADPGSG
jgi:hypothetical protein